MKKAKKRTKAQRSAAAKLSWERRRATADAAAGMGGGNPVPLVVAGQVEHNIELDPVAARYDAEPGYEVLNRELGEAFNQSAYGKGKVRHANGRPFHRQPIMENGRMFGPGFTAGQAAKKAQEALGMLKRDQKDAAIAEIHGAIVYLAATAALIRES